MKMIERFAKDLSKSIFWIVLYGSMCAVVFIATAIVGFYYPYVVKKDRAAMRLMKQNLSFVLLQEVPDSSNNTTLTGDAGNTEAQFFLQESLSRNGNMGAYIILPGENGFSQIIVLLGLYAELTPFQMPSEEDTVFAVTKNDKYMNDEISFLKKKYPVEIIPPEMEITHPMFYLGGEGDMFEDTLFIFSYNYEEVRNLFRNSMNRYVFENDFAERIVFRAETEENTNRIRQSISEMTGLFVTVRTMEQQMRITAATGERTHRLYLICYTTGAIAMIVAVLTMLYQTMNRKIPDYITHYLFGATSMEIRIRMLLLCVFHLLIPCCAVVILAGYFLRPHVVILSALISLVVIAAILSGISHKVFLHVLHQGAGRRLEWK